MGILLTWAFCHDWAKCHLGILTLGILSYLGILSPWAFYHRIKIRSLNRRVRKLEYDRDPKVLENSYEDFSDDDDESMELERNVKHRDANIEIANLSSTFGGGIETEAKEILSSPLLQKLLNKFRPEFS